MRPHLQHRTFFSGLAIVAGLGLITSGCGRSKPPSVASLGTTTAGTAGTGVSSSSASPSSGERLPMTMGVGRDGIGVRYSACMRSHGLPSFPDPNPEGLVTINASMGIDPNSPVFEKAEADCQKLLPVGKAPSQAEEQQFKRQALAFAACMRSHGVPNYPNPTVTGTRMTVHFSPSSGIEPNSPIFQAAQTSCQTKEPGGAALPPDG